MSSAAFDDEIDEEVCRRSRSETSRVCSDEEEGARAAPRRDMSSFVALLSFDII